MSRFKTTLLFVPVLVAGAIAAPSLYAQSSHEPSGSMMDHGMMGGKSEKGDGGMMGMMGQMSRMMDQCASMMQGGNRPNEQWRKPAEPDKGN
ncbi:MAG: hypothetical protein K8F62_09720 [Pseudorhodoplanes sp.]|nr:hypothetical protein [Pseudorhodoplanes sp.]